MMAHDASAISAAQGSTWSLDDTAAALEWSGVAIAYSQHRDSDALVRSNYRTIAADLGRFGSAVSVARLGHWAVGWLEHLTYDAGRTDVAAAVDGWRERLADYPVADEEDWSALEWEDNHPIGEDRCYAAPDDECPCGMVPA
jgi:hypothetical protein